MLTYAMAMTDVHWSDKFVSGGGDVVTLADVKLNCQIEITADDTGVLDNMIKRATAWIEEYTNRQFKDAERDVFLDRWPVVIELPRSPASVVSTVKYTDSNGDVQTLAASKYQTDFNSEPARIAPAFGEVWPSLRGGDFNAVEVRYTAGYGANDTDVPQGLRDACYLLIKNWYDNPGATTGRRPWKVPFGVHALINPYRIPVPS